ncbi:MAG TPA: hypothetical protein DCL41_03665 [Bdellovibrionales bacterium]|nr:hypothetical protein [Bdellovibrionales bacterium]
MNDLLTSENPSNGFLFSANQRPVGSEFQTYLGWDFEQPYRGLRIQHLLGQNSSVEVDDMLKMQNEAFNEWAFHFFKIVDRSQVLGMIHNSFAKQKFEKLLRWDFQDRPEALETSLFSAWFESVSDRLWADPFKFQKKKYYPKVSRSLIEIQKQIREDKESAYKMLAQDFEEGIKNLEKSYGSEEHWTWGEIHPTHFPHVTRFPGFEAATVRPQGSRYSLNSNKGTHGGAWRFVVNFSTPLKAWSQIPGGLNGNPVLPWYVDQIQEWTRGGFKEVQFQSQKETQKNSLESFVMEPL